MSLAVERSGQARAASAGPLAFERQPKESAKAFAAFSVYLWACLEKTDTEVVSFLS